MAYKDKDKQREAGRERQRRYKAKQKALLSGGVTSKALPKYTGLTLSNPSLIRLVEPCMRPGYVCPIPEDQRKLGINYGPYMTANQLAAAGLKANRVSVPGDEDYDGTCTPEWMAEKKRVDKAEDVAGSRKETQA